MHQVALGHLSPGLTAGTQNPTNTAATATCGMPVVHPRIRCGRSPGTAVDAVLDPDTGPSTRRHFSLSRRVVQLLTRRPPLLPPVPAARQAGVLVGIVVPG